MPDLVAPPAHAHRSLFATGGQGLHDNPAFEQHFSNLLGILQGIEAADPIWVQQLLDHVAVEEKMTLETAVTVLAFNCSQKLRSGNTSMGAMKTLIVNTIATKRYVGTCHGLHIVVD